LYNGKNTVPICLCLSWISGNNSPCGHHHVIMSSNPTIEIHENLVVSPIKHSFVIVVRRKDFTLRKVLKYHSASRQHFNIFGKVIKLTYFREDPGRKSCSLSLKLLRQMSSSAFAMDLYSVPKSSTAHHH